MSVLLQYLPAGLCTVHCQSKHINPVEYYIEAQEDTHTKHLQDKYSEVHNHSSNFKHPSLCFHYVLIIHYCFKWNSTGILWHYLKAEKRTEIKVVSCGIFYFVCFSISLLNAVMILPCSPQGQTLCAHLPLLLCQTGFCSFSLLCQTSAVDIFPLLVTKPIQ